MRCGQSVRVIKRRDEIWGLRTFRVTVLSIIFPYTVYTVRYTVNNINKNDKKYIFLLFFCVCVSFHLLYHIYHHMICTLSKRKRPLRRQSSFYELRMI